MSGVDMVLHVPYALDLAGAKEEKIRILFLALTVLGPYEICCIFFPQIQISFFFSNSAFSI